MANAVDAPRAGCRHGVEQRDLIDRVLDDDAGGVELLAGVGLALKDDHVRAGPRQRGRTGEGEGQGRCERGDARGQQQHQRQQG